MKSIRKFLLRMSQNFGLYLIRKADISPRPYLSFQGSKVLLDLDKFQKGMKPVMLHTQFGMVYVSEHFTCIRTKEGQTHYYWRDGVKESYLDIKDIEIANVADVISHKTYALANGEGTQHEVRFLGGGELQFLRLATGEIAEASFANLVTTTTPEGVVRVRVTN
jgi:hypothetical protein